MDEALPPKMPKIKAVIKECDLKDRDIYILLCKRFHSPGSSATFTTYKGRQVLEWELARSEPRCLDCEEKGMIQLRIITKDVSRRVKLVALRDTYNQLHYPREVFTQEARIGSHFVNMFEFPNDEEHIFEMTLFFFKTPEHREKFSKLCDDFAHLFTSQDQKNNYDYVLKIGDKDIHLHKAILLARCPQIMDKLCILSGDNWRSFLDVDPDALKSAFNFLYSGRCPLLDERAEDILRISEFLKIDDLRELAIESLIAQLRLSTSVKILKIADYFADKNLKEKAIMFIKRNLHRMNKNPAWCELEAYNHPLVKEVFDSCTACARNYRKIKNPEAHGLSQDLQLDNRVVEHPLVEGNEKVWRVSRSVPQGGVKKAGGMKQAGGMSQASGTTQGVPQGGMKQAGEEPQASGMKQVGEVAQASGVSQASGTTQGVPLGGMKQADEVAQGSGMKQSWGVSHASGTKQGVPLGGMKQADEVAQASGMKQAGGVSQASGTTQGVPQARGTTQGVPLGGMNQADEVAQAKAVEVAEAISRMKQAWEAHLASETTQGVPLGGMKQAGEVAQGSGMKQAWGVSQASGIKQTSRTRVFKKPQPSGVSHASRMKEAGEVSHPSGIKQKSWTRIFKKPALSGMIKASGVLQASPTKQAVGQGSEMKQAVPSGSGTHQAVKRPLPVYQNVELSQATGSQGVERLQATGTTQAVEMPRAAYQNIELTQASLSLLGIHTLAELSQATGSQGVETLQTTGTTQGVEMPRATGSQGVEMPRATGSQGVETLQATGTTQDVEMPQATPMLDNWLTQQATCLDPKATGVHPFVELLRERGIVGAEMPQDSEPQAHCSKKRDLPSPVLGEDIPYTVGHPLYCHMPNLPYDDSPESENSV